MENTEKQEYLSIDQAAAEIGIDRATVYAWMKELGMQRHKFLRNKKTYIHASDVERLKEIKARPWVAGRKPVPDKLRAPIPNTKNTGEQSKESDQSEEILV
jgi:hypothetical protein